MNSNEMMNREKKAGKMAAACFDAEITVDELAVATDENWQTIASLAKCNPPHSQETKDRVAALLYKAYADEEALADDKADQQWEESQEYAGNRCPPRE